MIDNKHSGTLHHSNLSNLNFLYTVLKNSFTGDNNQNTASPGMIFNVNNPNVPSTVPSNKPFLLSRPRYVKGQKIFNITKETNPFNRRKTVRVVYNGEEDNESVGELNMEESMEDGNDYEPMKGEVEHYENGEVHVKHEEEIYEDETFDWIHNNFLNK